MKSLQIHKRRYLYGIPLVADPPSKPGKPRATNWDKDFVELEWAKPKEDGGAPITKYIVEKKDRVMHY